MIAAKLANMPAEIEAYRKERHERRQKTELQKILDWKKRNPGGRTEHVCPDAASGLRNPRVAGKCGMNYEAFLIFAR
eukprot:35672-Rhodomonas_salina.3